MHGLALEQGQANHLGCEDLVDHGDHAGLGLAVRERARGSLGDAHDPVVGVHAHEHVLRDVHLAAGEAEGLAVRDGEGDGLHLGDLHLMTSGDRGGPAGRTEEQAGVVERRQHGADDGGGRLGPPGQGELDGRRVDDVAEDHPGQRQRTDRGRDQGDAEAGGDQGEQHGGAGRLVLLVRSEARLTTAAQDCLVDRRARVGVQDEALGPQVAHGDHRLEREPVVAGDGEDQRLDLDGAQGQVVAGRRGSEDAEVEAAVAQSCGLRRREHLGMDLQRDAGQVALDRAGDAGELGEGGGAGERDADQAQAALGDPAHAAHAVLDRAQHALGVAVEELTGGREADLSGGAGEQPRAELGLELADGLGERRLGHVQPGRRATEVAGLGDGREETQVPQLHGPSGGVWSRSRRPRTDSRYVRILMQHKVEFRSY